MKEDIAKVVGQQAVLFPTLFRKAIPRYFRTGQGSFSRIIWHRPEEDSAARERSGRESYGCSR